MEQQGHVHTQHQQDNLDSSYLKGIQKLFKIANNTQLSKTNQWTQASVWESGVFQITEDLHTKLQIGRTEVVPRRMSHNLERAWLKKKFKNSRIAQSHALPKSKGMDIFLNRPNPFFCTAKIHVFTNNACKWTQ